MTAATLSQLRDKSSFPVTGFSVYTNNSQRRIQACSACSAKQSPPQKEGHHKPENDDDDDHERKNFNVA